MLNIYEILKDCPKGTVLYSPIYGECKLECTTHDKHRSILIGNSTDYGVYLDQFGKHNPEGEVMIFPSKDNRDWETFKLYPTDTPMMVSHGGKIWNLRYYTGKGNRVYPNGQKQAEFNIRRDEKALIDYEYLVPIDDFDFNNPRSNTKKSI